MKKELREVVDLTLTRDLYRGMSGEVPNQHHPFKEKEKKRFALRIKKKTGLFTRLSLLGYSPPERECGLKPLRSSGKKKRKKPNISEGL